MSLSRVLQTLISVGIWVQTNLKARNQLVLPSWKQPISFAPRVEKLWNGAKLYFRKINLQVQSSRLRPVLRNVLLDCQNHLFAGALRTTAELPNRILAWLFPLLIISLWTKEFDDSCDWESLCLHCMSTFRNWIADLSSFLCGMRTNARRICSL
jgi:hypothetical protein